MSRAMASAWVCRSMACRYSPRLIVAEPQAAQRDALAVAVADLAGDGQRLGVQVDGLPVLAQAAVAAPQVAQRGALAVAVADVAGDGQRLGVQVDGLPVLAQAESGSSPGWSGGSAFRSRVGDPPVDAPVQLDQVR